MAKESMKARERKRAEVVDKYTERRENLKKELKKAYISGDMLKIRDLQFDLQRLPRNASPIRKHNRCKLTGRPRGYMRMFGISRIAFREMANQGLIPGIRKASLS